MAKKVIVAGGGASGMCAAIFAARSGADVTIIEKNTTLGKKLSMTGNGRCNLTNLDMSGECYNAAARTRMEKWLAGFSAKDACMFFRSLGVITRSEDGYIYPASGQAATVVEALLSEIKRLSITVVTGRQVKRIEAASSGDTSKASPSGDLSPGYTVVTDKERFEADAVIMATGSLSGAKSTMSTGDGYYICKQLGMNIKDTYPALVGFKCTGDEIMPKAGVRSMANISFYLGNELLAREYGEVQITPEGISGIPVMQASREVIRFVADKKPVVASLDLFPDHDEEEFEALKKDMLELRDSRSLGEFLQGFGNSNINEVVLKRMKLGPDMKMKNISESMVSCILDNYRDLRFRISDSYGYQASQVTTGGVSLGDIKDDMSFVKAPGVYITGELLDVDGRCGGYNLQWAWISGSIAGAAAAGCAGRK